MKNIEIIFKPTDAPQRDQYHRLLLAFECWNIDILVLNFKTTALLSILSLENEKLLYNFLT